MNRRRAGAAGRGLILASLLLLLAACGGSGGAPAPPAGRANLLLVTVSSLRADHLGIYGYPRNITPQLDLFAASGAVFLDALTPWPETGRAAAAALTGVDPARATRGAPARLLAGNSLAPRLAGLGYRTAAAVNHPALAAAFGFDRGFGEFREHWAAGADATEAVARFGRERVADPAAEAPFFVWLHFGAPSPPHEPSAEDREAVAADGLTPGGPRFRAGPTPAGAIPGGPAYGAAVDLYDAAIREVDRAAGRVLARLAAGPAAGNTLVVVAGLHGESLGEHGPAFDTPRSLFRETLHVPLLVGWPGAEGARLPAEMRFGSPVGLADIAPTALDLIGAPAPETVPVGTIGKSLVPALRGDEPRPHRRLYAQSGRGVFGVFDGRFRMLRIPVPGDTPPQFALFRLLRDPNEAENLYDQARSSMEPLKAHLETRRIQTVAWTQENERAAAPDPPPSPELAAALAARGYR